MQTIREGKATIRVPRNERLNRSVQGFYNPKMKHNRDISVLLLNALGKKKMGIADIMAGTGIRSIRFSLELKRGMIKELFVNDYSESAVKLIKSNLKLNKVDASVTCKDASVMLLEGCGYDYIDIDPFGSPNAFLDASVKRISREGILAVTATDTSSLAGTHPSAGIRKYWATPLKNWEMHETGLRILIRKVQLIGTQYEKALIPVFSYFKDHYFRVFFVCKKGKQAASQIIKQHGMFGEAGPMWLGKLWDDKLAEKMAKLCERYDDKELTRFLDVIKEESKIDSPMFIDVHGLCKEHGISIPRKEKLTAMKNTSSTHFSGTGVRTELTREQMLRKIR